VEESEQVSSRSAKRVGKAIMVKGEDMDGAGRKIVATGLV
jgi:hypothetical protein